MSLKNDANEYMRMKEQIEKNSTIIHKQKNNKSILNACIGLSILITVSVIAGVWFDKIDLNKFDFTALLSTLLAFFAIGLSVFFYVKANETSNRFYDNTYNFTKDISEKIGRMDERVGERLNNLGDNYNNMLDQFNNGFFNNEKDLAEEKEKKEEVNDELIKDLKEAIESNSINTEETIKDIKEKINILSESKLKISDLESSIKKQNSVQGLRRNLCDLFAFNPDIPTYELVAMANKLIKHVDDKSKEQLINMRLISNNELSKAGVKYFSSYQER